MNLLRLSHNIIAMDKENNIVETVDPEDDPFYRTSHLASFILEA